LELVLHTSWAVEGMAGTGEEHQTGENKRSHAEFLWEGGWEAGRLGSWRLLPEDFGGQGQGLGCVITGLASGGPQSCCCEWLEDTLGVAALLLGESPWPCGCGCGGVGSSQVSICSLREPGGSPLPSIHTQPSPNVL
jgi:hypothetical protein